MGENLFDGIVFPFFLKNSEVLGRVLGATSSELEFGPRDTKVNFAYHEAEEFYKFGIFWLDNCPKTGPYSRTACYYWLMPHFSKFPETYLATAIRVRPTKEKYKTPYEHDFIFWAKGEPASSGHQYILGSEIANQLLSNDRSLPDVVKAWQNEDYDLKFTKTIGELSNAYTTILKDIPKVQLDSAMKKLEIEARNAGWKSRAPLVEAVI